MTVIRPNPFIGYQSQRGRALSGDTPLLYILSGFFRTMSDNVAKQMKGVERKQPSRRRHLSLARADIVRNKSGIVIAWFDNVRLRRGAKIKSKQRQRTTIRKSLRIPIVLGSALKSSRKNLPILILKNREISLSCGPSTWKLCTPPPPHRIASASGDHGKDSRNSTISTWQLCPYNDFVDLVKKLG